MSPLWPESALARAAWANALERGLIDRKSLAEMEAKEDGMPKRDVPRRPIRRSVSSIAL